MFIQYFLKILVSICVSVLVGVGVFIGTNSVLGSVISGVVSGILGFFVAERLLYWLQFSKHFVFLEKLERQLSPPRLCPVILDDVEEAIWDAIKEEQTKVEELKSGINMSWQRYAELLKSSLRYNNYEFLATCFLTPTQLMDERFKPYMGVQKRLPQNLCSLFPRKRRLRVVAVQKKMILEEYVLTQKQIIIKQCFAWRRVEKVPLYFISRQDFEDLHRNKFNEIELNDFVYFGSNDYKWVVGGDVNYGDGEIPLEGIPFIKVIDSGNMSVDQYKCFVQMLLKSAKRIKNIDQLTKWCRT